MTAHSRYLACAATSLVLLLSAECRAEWGRYRAVTSYSVPSTPVYTPGVVVQGYRPVFVAPAAVPAVASAPISVAPPIIYAPQTAYYAPQTAYYAPAPFAAAPMTTYYAPAVQPMVVARPTFRRAPAVFSFTPSRAAIAVPVIVP